MFWLAAVVTMSGAAAQSELKIVQVATEDGARIAIKRKPAAGAPIILIHGLAVNADIWDLPAVKGADFEYRSLASILSESGYDLWLVNLRGHGGPKMLSEPPPGADDWCVDHFILYDVPAVVDHVLAKTGRKPFILACSMGSMAAAGYLQGAVLIGEGDKQRIVANVEIAEHRQEKLAGVVLVEFPAALRWPSSLYKKNGKLDWNALLRDWRRTDGDVNYPFEMLARWGWLEALVAGSGEVSLDWLRPDEPDKRWWKSLPRPVGERIERMENSVVRGMLKLSGTFTGKTNDRAEVILKGRRYVMDHMKAGVLLQMGKSVRAGAFVSALGEPEHVYSEHYEPIKLPVLVVAGGRDRIANADVTRAVFFEKISSTDKTFRLFEDMAHGEFEAAPMATKRVYPVIRDWIAKRDKRSAQP